MVYDSYSLNFLIFHIEPYALGSNLNVVIHPAIYEMITQGQ